MAGDAAPRRWARIVLLAVLALVLVAVAFVFGAANGPQPMRLTFGLVSWSGEAVHALFAAFLLGLFIMFLVGLSTDMAARAERRRLERRVQALARELETARAGRVPEADAAAYAPRPNPPAEGAV